MTSFGALLEKFAAVELDELADFDRAQALAAGLSPARVAEWELLHSAYFGPTTAPAQQRAAAQAARDAKVSLDVLAQIERCIKHITHTPTRNQLRRRLLSFARTAQATSHATCQAIAQFAKKIAPKKSPAPRESARFSAPRAGLATFTLTTDQHFIADLEAALRHGIADGRVDGRGDTVPASKHMAQRFKELFSDDEAASRPGSGAVPRSVPRPQLLVPLPEHTKIIRGDGDEVVLGLTNGTTMTGAEYLNTFIATAANGLEAALFHPTEGAVNLYRTQRLANQKQRDLARATQPVCTSPDCRHGADACEIHHVTAWKHGGHTNVDNLAPLCRYHNRVNDDDPHHRKRGRIEMRRGSPVWVSPTGHPRANTRHPFGAMQSLFPEHHVAARPV